MPASVSILRRVSAWLIDYLTVMIPGLILVLLAMAQLVHGLPGFVGSVAAESGWGYVAGTIFNTGTGGTTPASGAWISFALPLIVALLLVPFLQFVYQAVMLSWRGRTLGKMLLDTRVVKLSTSDTGRLPRGAALRRAFLTTALETGLVGAAMVLMTIGQFLLGMLLWAGAIVAFWVNALAAFSPGRRTLVDRLSGTAITHRGLYAELATAARTALPTSRTPTGRTATGRTATGRTATGRTAMDRTGTGVDRTAVDRAAIDRAGIDRAAIDGTVLDGTGIDRAGTAPSLPPGGSATAGPTLPTSGTPGGPAGPTGGAAGRKASEAALAAGRATADAAAVAGQLAREGAETVMRSAAVQQALNSRAGQQAQALGAAGAERARQLGAAGAEQARNLRGRAQELWRRRRANRDDDDGGNDDQQPMTQ